MTDREASEDVEVQTATDLALLSPDLAIEWADHLSEVLDLWQRVRTAAEVQRRLAATSDNLALG